MTGIRNSIFKLGALLLLGTLGTLPAAAHCDSLGGPVVATARRALDTGDVTPVLKWVGPEHEQEVREAFASTTKVRTLSAEARALADRFFFETVVRLHRTGEGEPYTGLKPSGEIDPGIAAADKALESGDITLLIAGVTPEVANGIRQRFSRVQQAKKHADEDVSSGRAYVAAYVDFIHYVETVRGAHVKDEEAPETRTDGNRRSGY